VLELFNSLGKHIETFQPARKDMVHIFTCGPSVYQRSHIGNFRTFLFEDILVRYLEYSGFIVKRGMNFTDIEDKAIQEAARTKTSLAALTDENIRGFMHEMEALRMRKPDHMPRASQSVDYAADIIERLLGLGVAYWHKGNVYFDPLKYHGFGELYGLDMTQWPAEKRRFHKDTYQGLRWNRGDFILWHGSEEKAEICWDTKIGRGRPAWNIQDPSMIIQYFNDTLSIYCGGIDNLFRHHDYSRAILESMRPYPMARFWLHCHHLYVDNRKMSKSKGTVYYIDTLRKQGYELDEIRFFLIYGHYRKRLNFSHKSMGRAAENLKRLKQTVSAILRYAEPGLNFDSAAAEETKRSFSRKMDRDLDVKGAIDNLQLLLSTMDVKHLKPGTASGVIRALREIDEVLQVIF
jgi:cysteinyl-tRNA synthetase